MNGMSVFGTYLAKMRLIQFKNYGWADSEKLQAKSEERRKNSTGGNGTNRSPN